MPLQNCKISQMAKWKIVYINEKSFFFFCNDCGTLKNKEKGDSLSIGSKTSLPTLVWSTNEPLVTKTLTSPPFTLVI